MPLTNLIDYEKKARSLLKAEHYDYFAGGAGDEITLKENGAAFDRIHLRPRVLRGEVDHGLSTSFLDVQLDTPVIIAPVAFHCLAHPDGECATAKAAIDSGSMMMISMAATTLLEEVTSVAPRNQSNRFCLQLYIEPDRGCTKELIARAETAGCAAIVVTVDSPVFGRHSRDIQNQFFDLPDGLHCANLKMHDSNEYRRIEFDPALCWNDIDWLCSVTNLPIILKGILHPEDARLAREHGARAIMVSNHGGRQLDGVAPTIDLLPDIAEVNDSKLPIVFDGGVRRGTDILKALALGATVVAVGRPVIWGLTVSGYDGVRGVLDCLKRDLLHVMQLTGCRSLAEINDDIIFRR